MTAPSIAAPVALTVTSPAFETGGLIPAGYTCDGGNISPPIEWSAPPKEAKSMALIVDDPDAPGDVFVHWVLFNLPGATTHVHENVRMGDHGPEGSVQGRNDFKRNGYGGPCPPSGTHRYFFHVYALDTTLAIGPKSRKDDVLAAMAGHVLATGALMARYSRND